MSDEKNDEKEIDPERLKAALQVVYDRDTITPTGPQWATLLGSLKGVSRAQQSIALVALQLATKDKPSSETLDQLLQRLRSSQTLIDLAILQLAGMLTKDDFQ